jgi:hypothetical protein
MSRTLWLFQRRVHKPLVSNGLNPLALGRSSRACRSVLLRWLAETMVSSAFNRVSLVFALAVVVSAGCGDECDECLLQAGCSACGDQPDLPSGDGSATQGSSDSSPSGETSASGSETNGDSSGADAGSASSSGVDTNTGGETETDGEEELPDDGYVSVVWSQANAEPATAFVIGQVYEIVEPGVTAVEFAQPRGVDDCALTSYTLEDLQQGSLPTYDHLSAGTLTLGSGGSALDVDPTGANMLYYRELEPGGVAFGGSYELDAPGGSFPGFSGQIDLPPMRQMIAPTPDFVAAGALTVQWSGGDPDEELLLRLEGMNMQGDRALVICRVDNDGEHTVPEAIIDELPNGRLSVHLEQRYQTHVIIDERAVRLSGSVVHIVVGSAP